MNGLNIGMHCLVVPEFAFQEDGHTSPKSKKKHWGTVIYIHPLGRFAVLEFSFPTGKIRESFQLDELE